MTKNYVKLIVIGVLSLIVTIVLMLSWYKIDTGERGVLLRNGAVVGVVDAGLHFKIPVFDTIHKISTRTHTVAFDKIQAYSKDQQPATIRVSITYHVPVNAVESIYQNFRDEGSMIANTVAKQVPNQVENTFGRYSAVAVVQSREQFVTDVSNNMRKALEQVPVSIDLVQIENIDFSDAYEKSIEDRMRAEVEVTTQRQNLEKEKINAEIAVTKAQAVADSQVAQAKAEAESIRLRGDAEAIAIKARAQALASNAALVQLTVAERWDGKLPSTMLPGSGVPFINVEGHK